MERVEYLDWLRALAISLVVLGHAARPMAPGGAVGVSVFFVLSGYLITFILLGDGILTVGNIGRFMVRRVARIYPMYLLQLVALGAGLTIVGSKHLDLFLHDLPGLLAFTAGASPGIPAYGVAVLWTLSAEFWFYVSFPVVLWAALASGRPVLSLCVVAAASVAAKMLGSGFPAILYYDHFIMGAIACLAVKNGRVATRLGDGRAPYAGVLAIVVVAAIPYPGSWNAAWYAQSLVAAAGTAVVIMALAVRAPTRSMPTVAFLGRISYSVYLVHALVLDARPQMASNVPLYIAVVLLISTSTYYLVERPFVRWAHRRVPFVPKVQPVAFV
jgi:peptidoglycan/LPS O-acetylase OafA/YrhL